MLTTCNNNEWTAILESPVYYSFYNSNSAGDDHRELIAFLERKIAGMHHELHGSNNIGK